MPAVAILGPRQCGKSTIAKHCLTQWEETLYLDLERPRDRNKLLDAEGFLTTNRDKLICLDEIQRVPELFPLLRGLIDEHGRNGQFLILGSASRELIRQSSESLAGRIAYLELTPFLSGEVQTDELDSLRRLWQRGGYPRSYLARSEEASYNWRIDFIKTFLERDIPMLSRRIPTERMERLWQMCAHNHGQLLNVSQLAGSLGLDGHTVRSYIDLLSGAFVLRVLRPFHGNLKKRLIKSPKVYVRDSGLLHALLGLEAYNDLLGHPVCGSSWEGLVIENVLARIKPTVRASFYRTAKGAELDLILEKGNRRIAVECKASSAPTVSRGFWNAIEDTEVDHAWIVSPLRASYPIREKTTVTSLTGFLTDSRVGGYLTA